MSGDRIKAALDIATKSGGIDEERHKAWVIDQMVRVLTGCPLEPRTATDYKGKSYVYWTYGESDEYKRFVQAYQDGKDGPDTHKWEVGTPP